MKRKLIIALLALAAVGCICLLSIPLRRIENSILHPGWGSCGRCVRTWDVATYHDTPYAWTKPGMMHMLVNGEDVAVTNFAKQLGIVLSPEQIERMGTPTPKASCFPLCEDCWRQLKTPEARLPFYRALIDEWGKGESVWPDVKASVLAGN